MTRVIVFGDRPGDRYRSPRTLRALARAAVGAEEVLGSRAALAERLSGLDGPAWLLRAGAWPVAPPAFPRPSGTGRPLAALGAVRPLAETSDAGWGELLAQTGGDLGAALPPEIHSLYLEPPLASRISASLAAGAGLRASLARAVRQCGARVVRVGGLDVFDDPALRVAQVVTSLQQGGAEKVAIDLASDLPRLGLTPSLIALGAPTRAAFPAPPGAIELAWEREEDRAARASRLAAALVALGIDVVHGHLLEGDDVARLAQGGPPLLLTIHNVRAGWPAGTGALRPGDAALMVACSRAAEADLRTARLPAPVRTVWNGIDFAAFAATPQREAAARAWRAGLGFDAADLVLLSVANPRPQKRLHRLPAVLAALQAELARRGQARQARLILAGAPSRASRAASESEAQVRAEVARLGLEAHVAWAGSVADVAPLLLAADVLVSTSAHEGLSLAHLEALAAGLPVVASDAGGTREIAHGGASLTVLPVDAPPAAFAIAILEAASARAAAGGRAEVHFARARMTEGYARLYPRVVEASRGRRRGDGILLVTNNLSTGGAQSSARRLLAGLAAEGVRARAVVLEEQPEYPTVGRRSLTEAGVEVLVLPPPNEIDPAQAVSRLLETLDADPPAAVLLWNALAEHKLLLVDGLLDVPVFDVSPGEMYFASLARYFARPRPGLPYRTPADYGARLRGVIVKYAAEAARAAATLGAPVHVVPNGVPLGEAPSPRELRAPLVIGTVARLAPHKKIEELLDALRRANGAMPPHVLRIAGGVERGADGYAEALVERARGLNVEWVGELADAGPFLRQLDLFALVAEPAGCPNASLEAMAQGLPVIATDVGGAGEQVEDGVTGRLVPPRDPAAFASALLTLCQQAEERSRLGAEARRRVEARFALARMVADYRRICLSS